RGVESLLAEDTRAVGVCEWHDDDIAFLQSADIAADGLNDADRLVAHAPPDLDGLHQLVGPKVTAADAGMTDRDERVGGFDQGGVGHVLDANVAGAVHESCTHCDLPPVSIASICACLRMAACMPGSSRKAAANCGSARI